MESYGPAINTSIKRKIAEPSVNASILAIESPENTRTDNSAERR